VLFARQRCQQGASEHQSSAQSLSAALPQPRDTPVRYVLLCNTDSILCCRYSPRWEAALPSVGKARSPPCCRPLKRWSCCPACRATSVVAFLRAGGSAGQNGHHKVAPATRARTPVLAQATLGRCSCLQSVRRRPPQLLARSTDGQAGRCEVHSGQSEWGGSARPQRTVAQELCSAARSARQQV